ncbi:MAG: serine/threonine protein kinase [Aeoliella sp.]
MASTFDANEPTIEAPSPLLAAGSTDRLREAARQMVNVVEGSTPHLSSETRDVLRVRLLAVSLLFFGGFSAFLVRWLVISENAPVGEPEVFVPWLFWVHCCVTAIMGLLALSLYQAKNLTLTKLRLAELIVFADPAIYMILLTQQKLHYGANLTDGAHLPAILGPWMMLIFTYALFIPNTWQRAAGVLGLIGLAPVGVILFQWWECPGFQQCLLAGHFGDYITEQIMIISLSVITAVVGVHLINKLRREVFAAKQLGQYRLKQKLGAGGMGEVYLAEHEMMKRPCAIKLIKPDKTGDPRVLARFEREVRSTAKLSHWNSIDVFDYGNTPDGTFYYVMEYLPGHNIGELVEHGGPVPPARTVYLMTQVCNALAEAHGIGLVHRDIKPANIFCAYRGGEFDVAKLLDFGLAKPTVDVGDSHLTVEGAITGSPLFMSPEQATGEREADARSDIYSLGAVMYFMLTGRPPFPYEQPMKVIVAHVSEEPSLPREFVPDLPLALEEVVMRCLEKVAEDRFHDVFALREALYGVHLDDEWSSERAADWWECEGCPQRKAMAALAVEEAAV